MDAKSIKTADIVNFIISFYLNVFLTIIRVKLKSN